ncbi:MAG: right-handed parallel beta-helix repeat-containing protein [Phycisphaeraceae bacterium]|nr:right-handed parallel beta-helix repeat-containing protein [Phycisphaeraceae bacterium]
MVALVLTFGSGGVALAEQDDEPKDEAAKKVYALPGFRDIEPKRTIVVGNDRELRQATRDAEPGDHIQIKPGTYRGDIFINELAGTADDPIFIGAKHAHEPPVIRGGRQGLHIVRPRHVMIHDLLIEDVALNGINIDDGMRPGGASHVTIRNVRVRNVGGQGNEDGIKLSGVQHFVVQSVTIERWGVGGSGIDMVGCHHGEIIESRFIHRAGVLSGNGIQAKGGSTEIVIRHCRFVNAAGRAVQIGGSTDLRFFRPEPAGFEARNITVEGCKIIGSAAAVAFVNAEDSVFRHNTVFRPTHWVLRILREQHARGFAPTRNNTFERNLIIYDAQSINDVANIGPGTEPLTFRFRENFWFSEDRSRSVPVLPTADRGAVIGRDPRFDGPLPGDLALSENSPAIGYGATAEFEPTRISSIWRSVNPDHEEDGSLVSPGP